jgi:hypothetical protein
MKLKLYTTSQHGQAECHQVWDKDSLLAEMPVLVFRGTNNVGAADKRALANAVRVFETLRKGEK